MEVYSIINNFSSNIPNGGQLFSEISSNLNIVTILNSITIDGDIVEILFSSTISGSEKIELDNIVAAHVPIFIPSTDNKLNISCKIISTKKSSFIRVATEIFPGSTYATATCISYSDGSSYDIQLFDKTNNQILCTTTLTNTLESIQDLGVLSNISPDPCQIEVSIKRNGGGNSLVYVESVTIRYN